ncbi:MAG TPA: transposase family protein [Amycolatopsis sp.]|uniref:Transposase family protein n=1 Tax=Amycolatopsis nalaikhensis TaxID=715472 RepID=A0ABY8XX94_9PSEU|nr:transposase family protein [Amycolatopsis sp. 2-2]WIV53048.1 transposase family protein [Amycolatopsis sp. 2-2]WIV60308.1 transposase family protein [Amycolatopsis sp. 2-2]WIV61071.1 transposase family protein [Amycolatopsis sp. 2-2]WIV61088.1 transposase family protein [Amycolatopsis sp. 2-2]
MSQSPAEGFGPLSYQVTLPLSRQTLQLVAGLIRTRRSRLRSRWRKATPAEQALAVLAVLRHDPRLAHIGGGLSVSASTVRRWVLEVIGLLAARATRLDRVLRRLVARGGSVVLVDGTLIRTRRRTGRANRANYSGKHKQHGLVTLGLTDEQGRLLWVSAALPGRTADITAARRLRIRQHLHAHGLTPAGDKGFHGWHKDVRATRDCPVCAGPCEQVVLTPYKAEARRPLTKAQKQANAAFAAMRCAVEGGFAALKHWHILDKLRLDTRHATTLLRALLVLTQHEQSVRDPQP